jgi:regulator of protease activity HflC (stomatin/prohibitin superfamily)
MEATNPMMKSIRVSLGERTVVFRDGLPVRALGPGSHLVFGFGLTSRSWSTAPLVFQMEPEIRAVLPAEWFGKIELGAHERAVLWHDGKPKVYLRPGTHHYWKVDDTLAVQVFDVNAEMPPMTDELAAVIPGDEYVEVTVREHERGLQYVRGRLVATLPPGRYAFWSSRDARVTAQTVDMRLLQLTVAGQELLTRDKVTLRLTLAVEYAIEDAALAARSVTSVKDTIYLLVQLASRQFVAGVTLDELLGSRDAMTRFLEAETSANAKKLGVRVERVGVKDVVLPGEMKTLLNKVIEAEKEAAANVILRREETAATRSLANTAKVMAEQPILLRLKELESLKEMAAQIHEVRVVVGANGLETLLPAGLLGDGTAAGEGGAPRKPAT